MRKRWKKLRKWQKRWIKILLLFTILVFSTPFFAGLWFQHNYNKLIQSLNADGKVNIQVLLFKRGFFHSYAKLRIIFNDPYLKIMLGSLNLDPSLLDFTVDQYIAHGPIVFPRGINPRSGLASLHNLTRFTNSYKIIMEDDDVIGLTGNYFKYFHTPAFEFVLPPNYHIKFANGIRGNLRIYPRKKLVSGNIDLIDFKTDDGEVFVTAPNAAIRFNQYKSPSGLWIGGLSLLVTEIDGYNSEGRSFLISGIDFDGDSYEAGDKLNDMLRLDIDRLQFGEQPIGPLHLILGINGLNISAIKNMTSAYQKIVVEGERYESQLSYKISMLFPMIFANGASIELSSFSLDTPVGPILMQGIMSWPVTDSTPPSDIADLYSASNAHASLRISRSLMDRVVKIASDLPFFRSLTPETRRSLMTLQSDLEAKSQQNFLMLSYFANTGLISEEAGVRLMNLQRNDVPIEVYSTEIKDLLMKKQMYLAASYLVRLKYLQVRNSEDILDNAVNIVQDSFSQKLRNGLVDWLNKGYIRSNKDDFVIYIEKQGEKVTLNGKEYVE